MSFAAPGAPDRVQTWWYEDVREDLCDACACDAATRRADCTRADLATAPRPQVPNELRAGFDPLEIDLSGNERLVVLGPGALSDFPSLERVTLPHALTYLAEDALPDGVRAASLEPGARRGRNFIDGGPTARFHDVCCSPGFAVGEEPTEQEAGERFCEQSGFSQLECESHDHGSCYCEWDEGECWWQKVHLHIEGRRPL